MEAWSRQGQPAAPRRVGNTPHHAHEGAADAQARAPCPVAPPQVPTPSSSPALELWARVLPPTLRSPSPATTPGGDPREGG